MKRRINSLKPRLGRVKVKNDMGSVFVIEVGSKTFT